MQPVKRRSPAGHRCIVVTPLGLRILKAIEAGVYRFSKRNRGRVRPKERSD